jgi:hypothetical protein
VIITRQTSSSITLHEIDGVGEPHPGNTIAVFPFGKFYRNSLEEAQRIAEITKRELEHGRRVNENPPFPPEDIGGITGGKRRSGF